MREIMAGVVHWDDGPVKNGNIESLIDWMQKNRDPNIFYHAFVSGDRVVTGASLDKVLYHCGAVQYTQLATDFFGEYYAPRYVHTKETPHLASPNLVTFGICMLHDKPGGGYTENTIKTGAKIMAGYFGSCGLTEEEMFTHTDIVGKDYKECPKFFVRHPLAWKRFKFLVKKELRKLYA